MIKFGKWVVKHRVLIIIIAVLLLIPSVIGMVKHVLIMICSHICRRIWIP